MHKILNEVFFGVGAFLLAGALFFSLSFGLPYSGGGEWQRLHQWKSLACALWWISLLTNCAAFPIVNRAFEEEYKNDQTRSSLLLNTIGVAIPLVLVWLDKVFPIFWLPHTMIVVSASALVGYFGNERRFRHSCALLLLCAGLISASSFTLQWRDDYMRNADWAKKHPIGRD